jgi:endonuclease III
MAKGIGPRRPSRSGRQDKVARTRMKAAPKNTSAKKQNRAKPSVRSAKSKPAKFDPVAPERVQEILKRLQVRYPDVQCALHHRSAWELLVATILSAQCTDVRVNMVTPELFRLYPTPKHLAAARPEEIEPVIRTTGFFRNKARSIVGAAKKVVEEFGGEVPDEMDQLLTIPGAARKTANVVLGSWFKKNEGVVVDTHVQRISRRLELTKEEAPPKIEQDLMRILPRAKWTDFSHQIIHHGRALCIARKAKCAECPLEDLCHAADKTWSSVPIHSSAKP